MQHAVKRINLLMSLEDWSCKVDLAARYPLLILVEYHMMVLHPDKIHQHRLIHKIKRLQAHHSRDFWLLLPVLSCMQIILFYGCMCNYIINEPNHEFHSLNWFTPPWDCNLLPGNFGKTGLQSHLFYIIDYAGGAYSAPPDALAGGYF